MIWQFLKDMVSVAMASKRIKMFWLCVFLLALVVQGLSIAEKDYRDDYIEKLKEYDVHPEKGERLVKCYDGTYEKYDPSFGMVCGKAVGGSSAFPDDKIFNINDLKLK